MIVSLKLLQTYFSKPLPAVAEISDALTFHAFEVEGVEERDGDTIFDVKVLPNRAHDCLSHRGVARELGAILGIPLKKTAAASFPKAQDVSTLGVEIKDKRANRYMALVVEGVTVGPSPKWLKEALGSLSQRSINNVVDTTNYVMFMLGQPLHAFDYSKVAGGKIVVRSGKKGEQLTTLDGKEVALEGTMVIADQEDPIAIAGVKGGTRAQVSEGTTTIILESANFDQSAIRETSQRLDIKTDASKRFESGLTPYLAEEALAMALEIIIKGEGKSVRVGLACDVFPKKPETASISIGLEGINRILGTTLSAKEVEKVWKRLDFTFQKNGNEYEIRPPGERLDLTIKEDLAEEVGRMVGYDQLVPTMPVEPLKAPKENKHWRVADIVRSVLAGAGFSEVYTYAFMGQGEIEVANPIAADKRYLRNNLMNGLKNAVTENLKHESDVRIFELGHIFGRHEGKLNEEYSFAGTMGFQKRKDAEPKEDFFFMKGVLDQVFEVLGIGEVRYEDAGGELVASIYSGDELLGTMTINSFELDFDMLVDLSGKPVLYKTPSRYPSIIRDVSLFVPVTTKAGDVEEVIRANTGEMVKSIELIDVFEPAYSQEEISSGKQPQKSFAFRLVIQSDEKTLSDQEANAVWDYVVVALEKTNPAWQVRK